MGFFWPLSGRDLLFRPSVHTFGKFSRKKVERIRIIQKNEILGERLAVMHATLVQYIHDNPMTSRSSELPAPFPPKGNLLHCSCITSFN
jgi:hypothetical protein